MAELYPVTHKFVKKQGVLYPVTHAFVKKKVEISGDTDFSITVNSGADSTFILPTSGRLNNANNSYSWIFDWGDGTSSTHSGTGTTTSGIAHDYPQSNTFYEIKIKPQDENELGWLRSFGFSTASTGSNANANKAKVFQVDGQLKEEMIRTLANDSYVCAYMFYNCTNLTMGDSFQLPQGVTSVGNYFCSYMFYYCTSLTMNTIFQLPQRIDNIGWYFCTSMFYYCISLTTGVIRFFGNVRMIAPQLNSLNVYSNTFSRCSNLTETLSEIPQLQEVPSSRRRTFESVPSAIIAPLHANWK